MGSAAVQASSARRESEPDQSPKAASPSAAATPIPASRGTGSLDVSLAPQQPETVVAIRPTPTESNAAASIATETTDALRGRASSVTPASTTSRDSRPEI